MVTEHYLLRSEKEWQGRAEAMQILDEVVEAIRDGDVKRIGHVTTRNFEGPLQTIIPWATNRFTDVLIEKCREKFADQFWGFWMLGGMAGGGMGFIFDPSVKQTAQQWLATTMIDVKQSMQTSLPFAMDPVVYNFKINDNGSFAELRRGDQADLPDRYYALVLPSLLRTEIRDLPKGRRIELERIGARCRNHGGATAGLLLDSVLPQGGSDAAQASSLQDILTTCGFDRQQHESIRGDLRSGRIGLSQNRLSASTTIRDVRRSDVTDVRGGIEQKYADLGAKAIRKGQVGVVTLAAGVGSRWTEGAGVCKAPPSVQSILGPPSKFPGSASGQEPAHDAIA